MLADDCSRIRPGGAGLELQSVVFDCAAGARGTRMLALDGVKVAAFNALKGYMPTLGLKAGVIATIVVDPQAQENPCDKEAIHDRGGD